jgi:hypothetical protein
MIFVNFNYRVGPFGFLTSSKVLADGDLNVGMLDQRMALEWIQTHIQIVSKLQVFILCFLIPFTISLAVILIGLA